MSVEVITCYDKEPVHSYLMLKEFHKTLENIGVKPTVLGYGQSWRGLMTKPLRFKEYLESGKCSADIVVMPDAFDVLFCKSLDILAERFLSLNSPIIACGEVNCFPEIGMACDYDQDETSPLRYLNSGFIVGYPDAVLEILKSMPLEEIGYDRQDENGVYTCPNDQYIWQLEYFKHRDIIKIDTSGSICLNLCNVENWQDYDPCALHFNGDKSPPYKQEIFKKLGL